MVKAETKFAGEKPPSCESTQGNFQVKMVDDERKVPEISEEVVVKSQDERQRRTPRTGVYIFLLVVVLLVGFVVVYVIQKTNRDKSRKKSCNLCDDYIVVTDLPNLSNGTSNAWHNNVSWEAQEEFYTLSEAISQQDIIGLRPIFRKDLPKDYIAYWEAKVNGKNGEKYVIISAARQTGDHRLAEKGPLPSPSDVLTAQARRIGYGCHRVYRLRPDGLMACEDTRENKIVAATRDIDSDSWDIDWKNLDKQVNRALPSLKRQWDNLAKRVRKDPEWRRFQWLSVKTSEVPTTATTPSRASSTQTPTSLETEFNFQVQETEDGFKAELGLRPGDSVRIPLGQGLREVRIKFVGLRDGDEKKMKGWKKRWQKRLCRVLCDVCQGDGNLDMTKISDRFFKLTKTGDRFIKVKVDADETFVRKYLEGHEIRFKVELRTRGSRVMVINYGIILRSSRYRRSFSDEYFAIPREELLPKYRQHKHGQCMTGTGPVAWAKILGYLDNVARTHNSSYQAITRLTGLPSPLPLTMDSSVENMIQRVFLSLGSHCSPHGRGVTSPAHVAQMKKTFRNALGRELKVVHRGNHEKESGPWTEFIRDLLKKGFPVIVSKETKNLSEHHYVVVTRIKQTAKYYSFCNDRTDVCSPWTLQEESLLFVHEEDKPGKWESADVHFVAAIVDK